MGNITEAKLSDYLNKISNWSIKLGVWGKIIRNYKVKIMRPEHSYHLVIHQLILYQYEYVKSLKSVDHPNSFWPMTYK